MDPLTEISLDALIEQTDAVAAAIAAGDWESATQLEIERRGLLRRYLERESLRHGNLEHLRASLSELHARSNQFVGEVHHHRNRIVHEACTVKRGRDAVKEYDPSR